MMERYVYHAPGVRGRGHADYLIFDRMKGLGQDSKAIASTADGQLAERLVELLNADERSKETARLRA